MDTPCVFISYSWSNDKVIELVIDFVNILRNNGIEVLIDRDQLKLGNDVNYFMEQAITNNKIKHVLIMCDKTYTEKANQRSKGVGTETQIITPLMYGKVEQTKFIPVVCEHDENNDPCLPTYLRSISYIDLTNQKRFEENINLLINFIKNADQSKESLDMRLFKSCKKKVYSIISGNEIPSDEYGFLQLSESELQKEAENGNIDAQYQLSQYIEKCWFELEENKKNRHWCYEAAKSGHPRAQLSLGRYYLEG